MAMLGLSLSLTSTQVSGVSSFISALVIRDRNNNPIVDRAGNYILRRG